MKQIGMKSSQIGLISIVLLSQWTTHAVLGQRTNSDKTSPNIVMIISDDAGYSDFSFQGSEQINTPQIDSIANRGVKFTAGYVTASVCSPSRAGMLTGRYQQRFGHEMNIPPRMSDKNGLPVSEQMIAELLKEQGYKTIGLGKWHLGYADKFHPNNRGFDEYYGFLQGARSFWPLESPTQLNRLLHNKQVVPEKFEYITDLLGERAAQYVRESKDQPFFIYLAFNAVHTPMHALKSDLQEIGDGVANEKRKKLIAMTRGLDRAVGKVLSAVKESEIEDNTIVFFINDNGGATNNASINQPLRGKKGSNFEGGIRVPFTAMWPAKWKPGTEYNYPVSTLDVLPTILAASGAGIQTKNALDGVDLSPFVRGDNNGRPHEVLYWRRGDKCAVRKHDMKWVRIGEEPAMLFDLSKDSAEQTNLADTNPDEVHEIEALFAKWEQEMIEPKWSYKKRGKRKRQGNKTASRDSNPMGLVQKAPIKQTRASISQLEMAVETFRLSTKRWPSEIVELIRRPEDVDEGDWKGPFVAVEDEEYLDVWGTEFKFERDNETDTLKIISAGPKKKFGDSDDVRSK